MSDITLLIVVTSCVSPIVTLLPVFSDEKNIPKTEVHIKAIKVIITIIKTTIQPPEIIA